MNEQPIFLGNMDLLREILQDESLYEDAARIAKEISVKAEEEAKITIEAFRREAKSRNL